MEDLTLGDIFDQIAAFEDRIARYYASIRDESADNKAKLLSYHLSRHRQHQQQGFAEMDAGEQDEIRQTRLEADAPFDLEKSFRFLDPRSESCTAEALLKDAGRHGRKLIDFYTKLCRQDLPEKARNVLETLIRVEERALIAIKKMMQMDYF
ncbi:MAG: hypothetical protein QGH42_08300 [Kiritimatiellia bacterium]|jgi:hypothetical protein|nr:hypothetical protein [Kiritimatiellia bacterium]MDP6630376.1 hypothetical protein [Kiritimatiellia bacterium]MDP6809833.1 hypothetical protein [Kiritimatiellia bacterium]MDP7024225.1 hypothetical protein [Kiritimatiellia bacterium]